MSQPQTLLATYSAELKLVLNDDFTPLRLPGMKTSESPRDPFRQSPVFSIESEVPSLSAAEVRSIMAELGSIWIAFLYLRMFARPCDLLDLSAVAEAVYWTEMEGFMPSPRVRRALARLDSGEGLPMAYPGVLETLSRTWQKIRVVPSFDRALEVHVSSRSDYVKLEERGEITAEELAVLDFLTDYLLLQRANQEDIRYANRLRSPGEALACVIARLDESHTDRHLDRAIRHLLNPQVFASVSQEAIGLKSECRSRSTSLLNALLAESDLAA